MNRTAASLFSVALLWGATTAGAQQFGTYLGTTTEGDWVEITVADDGLGRGIQRADR